MKKSYFTSIVVFNAFHIFSSIALAGSASFSDAKICKAGIAEIMGQSPKIIKVTKRDGGVTHLSYIRANDGTRWSYRCKLDKDSIVWSTETGRWRTLPSDEKITYSINGDAIEIMQKYEDGSTSKNIYYRAQLGK